jgi:hypothetical protein
MAGKVRSDAWWAGFPEERLDQIAEWCKAPKTEESPGGLQHAREQLAADGVKVSLSAVVRFFSWYRLQSNFAGCENFARSVEEALKKTPGLTADAISAAGQVAFTAAATARQDPEEFREMEYLRLAKETAATKARQKDQDLKLAERRVRVLEEKIQKAKEELTKIASKGGLTPETLRQIEEAAKLL